MAAIVEVRLFSGEAEDEGVQVETALGFGRTHQNSAYSVDPIPTPQSIGTRYSAPRQLGLVVTDSGGSVAIGSRDIRLASALPPGLVMGFKTVASPTVPARPTDVATDDTVPTGYTELTTTFQTFDGDSYPIDPDDDFSGMLLHLVLGVSSTFAATPSAAFSLPDIQITYTDGGVQQREIDNVTFSFSDPTITINPVYWKNVVVEYRLRDIS